MPRHTRRFCRAMTASAAVAVSIAAGSVAVAPASANDSTPFAGIAPVEVAALAQSRGGMRIGSFEFDIGVAISTALAEGLALTSEFDVVGGALSRIAVSGAADAVEGSAGPVLSNLPSGGVAWQVADGLMVLHDPTGLGSATIYNQLDHQAIRHRLDVNIRVTNFRERIGAFRANQAVGSALRHVTPGSP